MPVCQRVMCPPPDVLEHGGIAAGYPPEGSRKYPVSLTFSCQPGFDLVGNAETHCTSSGQWDHPLPACVPWPCSSPPVPQNGNIKVTVVGEHSIVAVVHCTSGFQLSDDSGNLTCGTSGRWIGAVHCIPEICPQPGRLPAEQSLASVRYDAQDSYQFGDEIHFSCADGFVLESETALTCMEHGRWSSKLPSCIPVTCPPITRLDYGVVSTSGASGDPAVSGSSIRFRCNQGFRLDGQPQIQCQADGQWSAATPQCRALFCPNPEEIDNSLTVIRGNHVGDTTHYTCNSGFHLIGESIRTCLPSGDWSDEDPACDPVVCPVPQIPPHGSWNVGGFIPGASIRFECHQGYTLLGSATITCLMDKQWSGDPPTCQLVTCPAIRHPDNGSIRLTQWSSTSEQLSPNSIQQIHFRSTVTYVCDEGYQLFGPEMRTCTAQGVWSERTPQCKSNSI